MSSREQRLEAALRNGQTLLRQVYGSKVDFAYAASLWLIEVDAVLGEQDTTPPARQAADELTALWDGPDYFGKERQDFAPPEVIHERMRAAAAAPQGEAEPLDFSGSRDGDDRRMSVAEDAFDGWEQD